MPSEKQLINDYVKKVEQLKRTAKEELKISDHEIEEIFEECFNELQPRQRWFDLVKNVIVQLIKAAFYGFILSLVAYFILLHHQPTLSLVMRNVQGLIYPSLKVLRHMAVPVISMFPGLTELYDESCLVQNPYFRVPEMDCYPCQNIHTVINLTGFTNTSLYQSGIPYVIQTEDNTVNISKLQELYRSNQQIFDEDTSNLYHSSNKSFRTINDILTNDFETTDHFILRINRMGPARVLRQIFRVTPRLKLWFGQSLERFLIVDGEEAESYFIPDTECSYGFIMQGSGQRTILLRPSKECFGICRPVSILLKPSNILFYNWWYWRPISIPLSPEKSIAFVGSYC